MAKGNLTAARLRELLHYDPETGVFTRRVSIRQFKAGTIAGCLAPSGYTVLCIDRTQQMAHRLAWLYVHGEWPAQFIDHINGQRSDNRMSNLRDVSMTTNNENLRQSKAGRKGLMGAYPKYRKFRATIQVDGKQKYLGSYSTEDAAHAAYVEAKRRLHAGCTL